MLEKAFSDALSGSTQEDIAELAGSSIDISDNMVTLRLLEVHDNEAIASLTIDLSVQTKYRALIRDCVLLDLG